MSEKYELKGTVKIIKDTEQVSDKFKKRTVVITTPDEKYPQDVAVEFTQDNCAKLDAVSLGEEVTVTFNIRGSEYKGRHFVNLSGWKIEPASPF